MEFKSKNINELLAILANALPLSAEFEKSLTNCVKLETVKPKKNWIPFRIEVRNGISQKKDNKLGRSY